MKNNPTTLNAWCIYDWANSAHALVVVSTIFPDYFVGVAKQPDGSPYINIFGFLVKNSVVFSYTVAIAYTFIVLLNPYLSALADYSGKKKRFMQFFVTLGALSCITMFFFTKDTQLLGVIAFALSLVGYSGSMVFYNAYLPEIATEDRYDSVSAKGFALGFLGSVLLLIFNLTMILMPQWYGGITEGMACRVSFLLTGLWWWGFAQYSLAYMPAGKALGKHTNIWQASAERRKKVRQAILNPQNQNAKFLKVFLISFFFYTMGLQTVMYIAAIFGKSELQIPSGMLIATILILQILAIFGAMGMSKVSNRWGNAQALRWVIMMWIIICLTAYFINQTGFYVLAIFIGLLMGGTQSLSRSTYAKLMPPETADKASYFAIYEVADKLAIVIGTASYAVIEQIMGSARYSVVALALYFAIGGILLLSLPSKKSYQ